MKCLFLIVLCLSCQSKAPLAKKQLKGSIDGIEIDHVVMKREGCRGSTVHIQLSLMNTSPDTIKLHSPKEIDYCQLDSVDAYLYLKVPDEIQNSLFWNIFHKDALIGVAYIDLREKAHILPQTAQQFEALLLLNIYSGSLQEIKTRYGPLFSSNFTIQTKNDFAYDIIFSKKENIVYTFKLDDKPIDANDSIQMNRSHSPIPPRIGYRMIDAKDTLEIIDGTCRWNGLSVLYAKLHEMPQ